MTCVLFALLRCAVPCCALLQVEGLGLDEESLSYLGEVGEETSLRHAVQVRCAPCASHL